MQKQFKNLIELFDYFKDDDTCKQFLAEQRWGKNVTCPHCGHNKVYVTNRGYKCAAKTCYKKFSATVGTVYENSKVPLRTWFAAMYLVTAHKKGISSLQLSRDLGITQKTAWFVLHRVREMVKIKAPNKLRNVVEVDETYVGGKNKNRHADKKILHSQGRSAKDKTPVLGAMQRGGVVHTFVVKDTSGATLKPILDNVVKQGSVMVTDEWRSYDCLNKDYYHVVINHQQEEYVRGAFHTNSIEGFWSLLKRGIYGIYHNVSPKHLQRYCEEFSYRYNTRDIKDSERFEFTVANCEGRLKYADLIA